MLLGWVLDAEGPVEILQCFTLALKKKKKKLIRDKSRKLPLKFKLKRNF
jgi:hypothetical protein